MTGVSAIIVYVSVIFVTRVTSWTIDLPEVRRFYFEKYSNNDGTSTTTESSLNSDQIPYDNINGDSLHNTDRKYQSIIDYFKHYEKNLHPINEYLQEQEESKPNVYANGYNYDTYMVKKVNNGVLANGPSYLDGLRLSIERYIEVLNNCSQNNFNTDAFRNRNISQLATNITDGEDFQNLCLRATETSEHVRRLADLALHATKRLQDVAFAAKYNKEASMEENELLLRLAWYLDKLAHLTGYDPAPESFTTEPPRRQAPVIPSFNPLNITDEDKARLLNCLREKSDEPATVRCSLPKVPSITQQIAALIPNPGASQPTSIMDTQRLSRSSDDTLVPTLEPEILVATDSRGILPPTLTAVKKVRKRSISDENNPLVKLLKYYTKYKMWEFSNPKTKLDEDLEVKPVDIKNYLTSKHVQKRSLPTDNPNSTKKIMHKPDLTTLKRFLDLDKMFTKKILPPKKVKALQKLIRNRRYVDHYGGVIRPRIPGNPQGDISYYVKNKEGTNLRPNLAEAALLRASLEAVFQRGDINVVHRYGSNYNPAIPAPFYLGALRTMTEGAMSV